MKSLLNTENKLRKFRPIILFHDHQYVKAGSGDLEHIHISYGDPKYLDIHKKRIHDMLEINGKYWLDFITYTREEHSPVPSLVSSPSPPLYEKKKSITTTTTNKRRRGNLPKAVTAILRDWLSQHKKHPYPTEEEKATLAIETNLNLNQISNWFINARRRILQPMIEEEEQIKQQQYHPSFYSQEEDRSRKRLPNDPSQKRVSISNRRKS